MSSSDNFDKMIRSRGKGGWYVRMAVAIVWCAVRQAPAETVKLEGCKATLSAAMACRYDGAGVRGTHKVEEGTATWKFPGSGGSYTMKAQWWAERDGSCPYNVKIDGSTVKSGNVPYYAGKLECDAGKGGVKTVTLGTVKVGKAASVVYWTRSVYPCGLDHGAYGILQALLFEGGGVTGAADLGGKPMATARRVPTTQFAPDGTVRTAGLGSGDRLIVSDLRGRICARISAGSGGSALVSVKAPGLYTVSTKNPGERGSALPTPLTGD